MKSKLNIKSIIIVAIIGIFSLVFLNKSFAAVTGKVNVDVANIRQAMNSNSTILEQASKGEKVEIVEKSGEWYKVKYNGVTGYIKGDLLEVSDNSSNVTATNNETNKETNKEDNNQNQDNTQVVEKQVEETNKQEQPAESTEQIENKKEDTKSATEETNKGDEKEGMYVTSEKIQLKIIPLVNGNNIKEINKDENISVLEVYNNWALVECGLDRGWVLYSKIKKVEEGQENTVKVPEKEEQKEEKQDEKKEEEQKTQEEEKIKTTEVAVPEKTMYINWDVVNLRSEPTTSSNSLAKLSKATAVTVFAKDNDWSKVKVNGKEGYIKSTLLSETKPEVVTSRNLEQERQAAQAPAQENNTSATQEQQAASQSATTQPAATQPATQSSGMGEQVCSYARQYLKCPYVYGGTTPSGFDCSGFTQYVYKHFGVTLNRTAQAQAGNGTYVAKSDLRAGDLLIFTNHAGIYLGNGTFIHAANKNSGVIITSLSDSYYTRNYITARRIFN